MQKERRAQESTSAAETDIILWGERRIATRKDPVEVNITRRRAGEKTMEEGKKKRSLFGGVGDEKGRYIAGSLRHAKTAPPR